MAVGSQNCLGLLSACRRLQLVPSRIACQGEERNPQELSTGTVSWVNPKTHVHTNIRRRSLPTALDPGQALPTGSLTSAGDMDPAQLGGNAGA